MRNVNTIYKAEEELCDRIWYTRYYLAMKEEIAKGQCKIVTEVPEGDHPELVRADVWLGAMEHARMVEKLYGKKNLSYSDFEWGMINGKLSALRWATGLSWNDLST